ncbi:hypothetical protein CMUST_02520 [Corynebacterium mustelae]|uniref:Uncharacterized protein n=1 Tax=Corynebacterium mustelae TaxID=571915 RepID=A0A0G3GZ69_9CORY|nr:hypothetical protein [Corynebacterium mustelae]AKK04848.1 hypothetical protein CMUST_02520 [Corynebacterium mustelae]
MTHHNMRPKSVTTDVLYKERLAFLHDDPEAYFRRYPWPRFGFEFSEEPKED